VELIYDRLKLFIKLSLHVATAMWSRQFFGSFQEPLSDFSSISFHWCWWLSQLHVTGCDHTVSCSKVGKYSKAPFTLYGDVVIEHVDFYGSVHTHSICAACCVAGDRRLCTERLKRGSELKSTLSERAFHAFTMCSLKKFALAWNMRLLE